MKKLLITLLALAVAGGSAFAQGWTFNGAVFGGVGMFFDEGTPADPDAGVPAGDREMRIAPFSSFQNAAGFRAQLDTHFVNADSTAGMSMRLVTNQGILPGEPGNAGAMLEWIYGWLSFQNNAIRLYGGRVDNAFFNTQDRMTGQDNGDGLGLLTVVNPIENLHLGLGVFTAGDGQIIPGGPTDGPRATVGLRFDVPDVVRITGGWRNAQSPIGMISGLPPANASHAYVSLGLLGVQNVHAALTARMTNIEDFADSGNMLFYLTLGHTGLVDGLDLRLGGAFGMTMADETVFGNDPSNHLWLWLNIDYHVNANIVPRLHLHFVQGGGWLNERSSHHWAVRNAPSFDSEQAFINVMPSVQVRVTPAALMEFGGFIHSDIGDYASRGGRENGLNAGIFLMKQVSF